MKEKSLEINRDSVELLLYLLWQLPTIPLLSSTTVFYTTVYSTTVTTTTVTTTTVTTTTVTTTTVTTTAVTTTTVTTTTVLSLPLLYSHYHYCYRRCRNRDNVTRAANELRISEIAPNSE